MKLLHIARTVVAFVPAFCWGQNDISTLDASTPNPHAPGITASTSSLSPLENINLSNGILTFAVPLHQVAGRGQAGYTMKLPIGTLWNIENHFNQGQDIWSPIWTVMAAGSIWATRSAIPYSPGRVIRRDAFDQSQSTFRCTSSGNTLYEGQTLTKIVWIEPDATEHEFRDVLNGGNPARVGVSYGCATNPNTGGPDRGTAFESDDSQAATFVADSDIHDDITTLNYTEHTGKGLAGWILFRDGTRYQTDINGNVTLIEDRNGNQISFNYASDFLSYTITDSLDRVTTVTLGASTDPGTATDTIQFPGSSGAVRTITVNWALLDQQLRSGYAIQTLNTLLPTVNNTPALFDPPVISSVTLQDQSQYQFLYDSYGELARVTLPAGGALEYDYPQSTPLCLADGQACTISPGNGDGDIQAVYRRLITRRVYPDGTTLEGSTGYSAAYPSTNTVVTVKRNNAAGTLIAQEVHSFSGAPLVNDSYPNPPYHWYADPLQGKEFKTEWRDSGGNNLKTLEMTWGVTSGVNVNLCQTQTTWFGTAQAVAGTISQYDAYSNGTDLYEYDFGAAPALSAVCPAAASGIKRHTHWGFLADGVYDTTGSTAQLSNHMRNLLEETAIYDGSNSTPSSQTKYAYDENRLQSESGAFGQIDPQHTKRGNRTTAARWKNPGNSYLNTSYGYDNLGNVLSIADPLNHSTTFTYADSCDVGAPGGSVSLFAFPSQAKNVLNHVTNVVYDCGTGNPTRVIDPNQNTLATAYAGDPFERLLHSTRSQGVATDESQTAYAYPDLKTVVVSGDRDSSGDGLIVSKQINDGLGRLVENRQYLDGSNYIAVKRSYDDLGRLFQVSNPYVPSTETAHYSTTSFDALGREIQISMADGSIMAYAYDSTSSSLLSTFTDAAGKKRTAVSDALGRLTSVTEDPGGLSQATTYAYDALDDLLTVAQGSRPRSFTYDSLGELISAVNPENGTVCYGLVNSGCSGDYDVNGNLQHRTDARGAVTAYSYDALNRLTVKSYTGTPGAPAVSYSYDTVGVANSIGRLTRMSSTLSTSSVLAYDTLGRVAATSQFTDGLTYTFPNYIYNRRGALRQITYPSGRVITTGSFDGLGRAGSLTSGTTSYASSVQYASHGPITQLTYGNGIIEKMVWDPVRLQPETITSVSGGLTLLALGFYYCPGGGTSCSTNNGNVLRHTIAASSGVFATENYTYDPLNRVGGASETGGTNEWSQVYSYDAYGNRAVSGYSPSLNVPVALGDYNGNNQWQRGAGDAYDPSGNQLSVASPGAVSVPSNVFTFDAENRMVTANVANTGTVTYTYDGDGRRVEKDTGVVKTIFVYDGAGQLAAEYSNASQSGQGTLYITGDTLGSTRLVTGATLGIVNPKWYDYVPFGDEIPSGVGSRTSAYGAGTYPTSPDVISTQFTGKERDAESGLDYFGARYFSSAQGRFTSPDRPFVDQDPLNPQSWNLYSYVRNNPLRGIDPDGRSCVDTSNGKGDDSDGKGCSDAGVSPTKDLKPPKPGDSSDIAPNPNSTGDPNNPNIQGNTAAAKFEPFSISALYSAARDYVRTAQTPLMVSVGVGAPFLANSIGPQISIALIPRTRRVCVSGGFYVATPGSDFVNFTAGVLAVGPLDKAEDVVSGFGVGGTLQDTEGRGYQVSSSSSGTLGGPSVGTRGTSLNAGYGGCFTVGR